MFTTEKLYPFKQTNGVDWTNDDLIKKFSSAFVVAKITEPQHQYEKLVVYIAGIGVEGNQGATDYNKLSIRYRESPEKPMVSAVVKASSFYIIDDRPESCITNNGDLHALLMVYNPERQWRRGFGPQNCYLYTSYPWLALLHNDWNIDIAQSIVTPAHTTLEDGLTLFAKNKHATGRAIDNKFWLARKKGDDAVKLFRRRAFIGAFLGKKFFVNSTASCFKMELNDRFPELKVQG